MTQENPATPVPGAAPAAPVAATPGSDTTQVTPPSGTPAAATPAPGNTTDGTVTISAKEYRELNRDAARARSPKGQRTYQRPAGPAANVDPNDPAAAAIAQANAERDQANQKAMRLEVGGKVRDLLADDRFKVIPESTKKLILERPYMLSEAETLDDAMYDIETVLLDIVANPGIVAASAAPGAPATVPARETPPVATPGAPSPVDAGVIEPTENLRGPARSQAVLRNLVRAGTAKK